MHTYVVTVRLPKNPAHDPQNKITGTCPMNGEGTCTDVTGEHHSTLIMSDQPAAALAGTLQAEGLHVTRIEEMI